MHPIPRPSHIRRHHERIVDRIRSSVGPIRCCWHGPNRGGRHIDLVLAEAPDTSCLTLSTVGMSAQPMPVPPVAAGKERIELLMTLPAAWPTPAENELKFGAGWPIRALLDLAHYPFERASFLHEGHSMAFLPEESFDPDTGLAAWILTEWAGIPPQDKIRFLHAIPVHPEELEWKLDLGLDVVLGRLSALDHWPGLALDRPCLGDPR